MSRGIVIAGGGLAAQRCAETLRRGGYDGRVRMICAEPLRPYDRPPLSKAALAAGHDDDDALSFRAAGWYDDKWIELMLGATAVGLDARRRSIALADGGIVAYDQLLIATGSRALLPPPLRGLSNVTTLRTLGDARALRGAFAAGGPVVVVGAGFVGQEVAAAARRAGVAVTLVEAMPAPLLSLGGTMGRWFADLHSAHDVDVVLGRRVVGVEGAGRAEAVLLDDGRRLPCAHVVVGVGVAPATAWTAGNGLGDRGVQVDALGRTAVENVFAAGDAAATFDPVIGEHVPGAHWEAAARQGAAAARAMLGAAAAPAAQASFWSDLYDVRLQVVGRAALADDAAVDGDLDARDFTVTYTRAGAPVAVLLANRPQELPRARALLAA